MEINQATGQSMDKISTPQPPSMVRAIDPTLPASAALKTAVLVSVLMAAVAEIVTVYVDVLGGAILYGILLLVFTNLAYFSRSRVGSQIYLALTLLPLLRILSLAMPIQQVAPIFRYVMTGIPLLISTVLVIRANGLPYLRLNLKGAEWLFQVLIGASGIPLGIIASLLLVPPPELLDNPNLAWIFVLWVAYTLFGAVMEEIIFRGIIQKALASTFGFYSVLISTLLYAAMFLGTLSPGYVVFYGLTGFLFSLWVRLSDSILGVIVAHSLMNIVFLLVFYLF